MILIVVDCFCRLWFARLQYWFHFLLCSCSRLCCYQFFGHRKSQRCIADYVVMHDAFWNCKLLKCNPFCDSHSAFPLCVCVYHRYAKNNIPIVSICINITYYYRCNDINSTNDPLMSKKHQYTFRSSNAHSIQWVQQSGNNRLIFHIFH